MSRTPTRASGETRGRRLVARRWRTVALVATGVVLGSALAAPPVFSHVGGSVAHLWTQHIRPKTDARYYTKAQASARYYDVGEAVAQAGNAEQLDGIDSAGFLAAGAKAADSDKLDGLDSTGFLAAGAKAADSDKLDGLDSTGFLAAGAKAADSEKLDGIDSTGFLAAGAKAADSDKLDGLDSTGFVHGRGSTKRASASGPFASIDEQTPAGNTLNLFCAGGNATFRFYNRSAHAALAVWGERASTGEVTFQTIPAGSFRNIHLNSVSSVTDRITVQAWTGTRSETIDAWVLAGSGTCQLNATLSGD